MKLFRRLLALFMSLSTLCGMASAFDTSRDSGLLWLVNKTHSVSENYVPELVSLTGISEASDGYQLRKEAADALYTMFAAMAADGVNCNVISGYRSYEYQLQLVTQKVAKRVENGQDPDYAYQQVTMSTAPAGCSEHQLGLAIDFSAGKKSSVYFGDTAAGTWLRNHAWEYGFILRYQESKMSYTNIVAEPWHYRYIGIPHAQIIHQKGWCYEQYISYLHKHGSYSLIIDDASYDIFWTQDTSANYQNVIDISSDNDGGWIITTKTIIDPLQYVRGHWSEDSFIALQERGAVFKQRITPENAITRGEFAALCGLNPPSASHAPLTRQAAARLLADAVEDETCAHLVYTDLNAISDSAVRSVQICVASGFFPHTAGLAFRPTDQMTWAEAAMTAMQYLEYSDSHTDENKLRFTALLLPEQKR